MDKISPTTQEDLFRSTKSGLYFGLGLPHAEGDLSSFAVAQINAPESGDIVRLLWKRLYVALGFDLIDDELTIIEDLRRRFAEIDRSGRSAVVVVRNAHLLPIEALSALKMILELPTGFDKRPLILLLGNTLEIERSLTNAGMIEHSADAVINGFHLVQGGEQGQESPATV